MVEQMLDIIEEAHKHRGHTRHWDAICMTPAQKQALMDECCADAPELHTLASFHGMKVLAFQSYTGDPMLVDTNSPTGQRFLRVLALCDELAERLATTGRL